MARGKHSTRSSNSSLSQHPVSSNFHKHSDSHQRSPPHLDGALPLSSSPLLNVGCGHTPAPALTSPISAVGYGQMQALPTNVTHRDKLEILAGHYASLITGTSFAYAHMYMNRHKCDISQSSSTNVVGQSKGTSFIHHNSCCTDIFSSYFYYISQLDVGEW